MDKREKKELYDKICRELTNYEHSESTPEVDKGYLEENGTEPFLGWLAGGEVFKLDGYNNEEVKELMAFAESISLEVDKLVWQIESGGEI